MNARARVDHHRRWHIVVFHKPFKGVDSIFFGQVAFFCLSLFQAAVQINKERAVEEAVLSLAAVTIKGT